MQRERKEKYNRERNSYSLWQCPFRRHLWSLSLRESYERNMKKWKLETSCVLTRTTTRRNESPSAQRRQSKRNIEMKRKCVYLSSNDSNDRKWMKLKWRAEIYSSWRENIEKYEEAFNEERRNEISWNAEKRSREISEIEKYTTYILPFSLAVKAYHSSIRREKYWERSYEEIEKTSEKYK